MSVQTAPCVSPDQFRALMRNLAGTVTVISTECDGEDFGFTATAVCSICAEPATVMIAVNKSTRTCAPLTRKGAFSVTILSDGQSDMAAHFASKGTDQFAAVAHDRGPLNLPVIRAASAVLHCEVVESRDIGTHRIFFGQVIDGDSSSRDPLIYHNAAYKTLSPAG